MVKPRFYASIVDPKEFGCEFSDFYLLKAGLIVWGITKIKGSLQKSWPITYDTCPFNSKSKRNRLQRQDEVESGNAEFKF